MTVLVLGAPVCVVSNLLKRADTSRVEAWTGLVLRTKIEPVCCTLFVYSKCPALWVFEVILTRQSIPSTSGLAT